MTSNDTHWKGVHVSQLNTSLNHFQFPELVSNEEHTILFRLPVTVETVPQCFPSIFNRRDYWDSNHVKLPCSERNVTRDQISRWDLIRQALTSQILSIEQFEAAILHYNARYATQWNFSALHLFFKDVMDEMETALFFEDLLPKIIDLALRLPELITGGIPLLRCGYKHSVSLSQVQISCLLANAFLCTFPHRNCKKNAEYWDYPHINFNRLFQCNYQARIQPVIEKIKCLINYFRRVTSEGVVTYSRQLVPDNLFPNWANSNKNLPRLYVSSEGTIEDDGFGLFQVDFANKFVGGGVIGTGCVQEEIRFVICPELILSGLFTQCLGENEALVITGCERFNKYKGYGSSFEWGGDYVDGTPSDKYGRKYCTIIALDALNFVQNPLSQYLPRNISRDLNKAYVGFSWSSRHKKEELCAVATGNWGCGAFRGDPKLKSFLQLMAAGEVGRDLAYFTFGNVELKDELAATHEFLVENKVTIGKLYSLLEVYYSKEFYKTDGIFEFFRNEASKKPQIIKMENEISKMNVSIGLRRLEITKKSSSCYKTKVSDWFRPVGEIGSSTMEVDSLRNKVDIDEAESDLMVEKRKSEIEILKKFYGQSSIDQSTASVETPSVIDDCFEILNKFKESLKRKTAPIINDTYQSNTNEGGPCDDMASRWTDENANSNTNRESTLNGENSCLDSEIDGKCRSNTNVGCEVDLKSNMQSSNENLGLHAKSVEYSERKGAEKKSATAEVIDLTSNEVKVTKSNSLKKEYEVSETLEIENPDSDERRQNEYLDEESVAQNNLHLDSEREVNSEIAKAERENLNQNRVETLSSLAKRQKKSKTPKRTTRLLSNRHSLGSLSASKKRKISDYFNSKSE